MVVVFVVCVVRVVVVCVVGVVVVWGGKWVTVCVTLFVTLTRITCATVFYMLTTFRLPFTVVVSIIFRVTPLPQVFNLGC